MVQDHSRRPGARRVGATGQRNLADTVAPRRIRFCRQIRRSRHAVRHTAERRPPRILLRREGRDRRRVLGRGNICGRNVRARSERTRRSHEDRRQMKRLLQFLKRRRLLVVSLLTMTATASWLRCGPLPDGLLDDQLSASTVVIDRHGEVLFESRSPTGTRTTQISPEAIPVTLEHATLAAEDERFFSHPGLDPLAIGRALWRDVRARRILEGGSTITQQVAKLLLARAEGADTRRGWMGKAREAVIA